MRLEPVFRQAEKEWKAFIEVFTDRIAEADPQIPHLPPKDVIHRIYRDVSELRPFAYPLITVTLRLRSGLAMTRPRTKPTCQLPSPGAVGKASSLIVRPHAPTIHSD